MTQKEVIQSCLRQRTISSYDETIEKWSIHSSNEHKNLKHA